MKKMYLFAFLFVITNAMLLPCNINAELNQNNKTLQLAPTTVQKAKIYAVKLKNSPIKYPQVRGLSNKNAELKINATLQQGAQLANQHRIKLFADEKEAKKNWDASQGPWRAYEYVFTYKVPFNDSGKLSVIYNEYSYTGGAHGMTIGTTYNFDTMTGNIIPLSKLIKGKEKSIQDYTYQQLQKKYSGYILIKSPNEIILNDKNRLWVFDKVGIKLIFNEYEVAAYVAGMPEIVVPFSYIRN